MKLNCLMKYYRIYVLKQSRPYTYVGYLNVPGTVAYKSSDCKNLHFKFDIEYIYTYSIEAVSKINFIVITDRVL